MDVVIAVILVFTWIQLEQILLLSLSRLRSCCRKTKVVVEVMFVAIATSCGVVAKFNPDLLKKLEEVALAVATFSYF